MNRKDTTRHGISAFNGAIRYFKTTLPYPVRFISGIYDLGSFSTAEKIDVVIAVL